MSVIDSGQVTKQVVYCNSGAAETKGGVVWGTGNDSTGVGTPGAPYLTIEQCLKEIRTEEGQEETTQKWEIRAVASDDESNDYGSVLHDSDATFPSTNSAALAITVKGYLKSWGDGVYGDKSGKWVDHLDKPTFGNYRRTVTTNVWGPRFFEYVNIEFINNSSNIADHEANEGKFDPVSKFFGCKFSGTSSKAGMSTGATYVACIWDDLLLDTTSVNGSTILSYYANCYFHNTTKDVFHGFDNAGQGDIWTYVMNSIFNVNGTGLLCYKCVAGATLISRYFRNNNRYWLRGGADFAEWVPSTITSSFAPNGQFDDTSSEGDPGIVSDTNPALTNSSLVVDKGAKPNNTANMKINDYSGNGYQDVDSLNFPWGDSIDVNTPVTNPSLGSFTHRSVGPVQNALGFVAPTGPLVYPKDIINEIPVWMAAEVPVDLDLTGTCQMRFGQASDVGFTSDIIIVDSCPLTIDASNNKINFTEDGGSELTATLTNDIYTTDELLVEIKSAMEAAGAGTYTITFDGASGTDTRIMTVAVSGAISTCILLFATGTDIANTAAPNMGFRPVDTADQASHDGEDPTLENFYDSNLTFEYSTNYDGVSDPATSGTWFAVGTGEPSDSGIQGTDGVSCDVVGKHVRCDMATLSPMLQKYHAVQFWTGNKKSNNEAP